MLNELLPFHCPKCSASILVEDSLLNSYFHGKGLCPKNGCQFNLLYEVARTITAMAPMGSIYPLIDASLRIFSAPIKQGLDEITIPSIENDQEILSINYTPRSEWPIIFAEVRGNTPKLFRYSSNSVSLWSSQDCTMNILAWVLRKQPANLWIQLITEACEMFTLKNYTLLAVAANAACEHLSSLYFENILKKWAGTQLSLVSKHIERFIKHKLTYGYQLDIVIPLLKPVLPEPILSALKSLRDGRNEIAHGNQFQQKEEIEYAQWIVAAVFLKKYFEIATIDHL